LGSREQSAAYLEEQPKLVISLSLLFQPFLCKRQMAHIRRVHEPKLRGDLKKDIPNALNDERLFTLADVEDLD
jgi:hypothetical protein